MLLLLAGRREMSVSSVEYSSLLNADLVDRIPLKDGAGEAKFLMGLRLTVET